MLRNIVTAVVSPLVWPMNQADFIRSSSSVAPAVMSSRAPASANASNFRSRISDVQAAIPSVLFTSSATAASIARRGSGFPKPSTASPSRVIPVTE